MKDLILEMQYLRMLHIKDIPVVPFIQSSTGFAFENSGKAVVALHRVQGKHPAPSEFICKDVGAHLARIHSVPFSDFPPKKNWLRKSYVPEAVALVQKHLPSYSKQVTAAYDSLKHFDFASLPKSITHGDVNQMNVLYNKKTVTAFLDWEEVGTEVSLLDLSICILGFCVEGRTLKNVWFQNLLEGYQGIRPLTRPEKQCLPQAIRYAGFIVSIWSILHIHFYHRRSITEVGNVNFYWDFAWEHIECID